MTSRGKEDHPAHRPHLAMKPPDRLPQDSNMIYPRKQVSCPEFALKSKKLEPAGDTLSTFEAAQEHVVNVTTTPATPKRLPTTTVWIKTNQTMVEVPNQGIGVCCWWPMPPPNPSNHPPPPNTSDHPPRWGETKQTYMIDFLQ